jgi:hypothetical protein
VERIDRRFGDQYRPRSTGARVRHRRPLAAIADFVDRAREGVAALAARLAAAGRLLTEAHGAGARVALWGAGAKGVAFLTLLSGRVDVVVDINPRKRGHYMPGSGIRVDGPDALAEDPPELVFVLNPMYAGEIETMLRDRSVDAEVVVV